MKLLAELAGQIDLSDSVIYWVLHGNDPSSLSPDARKLMQGHNKFLILGQDADTFFSKLMEGLNLGAPEWVKNPTGALIQEAGRITPAKNNQDINAVISHYKKRLEDLALYPDNASENVKALDQIHNLRLAGKHEDALVLLRKMEESHDANIWRMQAESASQIGLHSLEPQWQQESIVAWRKVLELLPKTKYPNEWAEAQNELGIVLGNTDQYDEAEKAYHAALEVRTRESTPVEWAKTQNNLANVLSKQGDRERRNNKLEKAVDIYNSAVAAYRAAIDVYANENRPIDWSVTTSNLGNTLTLVGMYANDESKLNEALMSYQAALGIQTPEITPWDWARTQNGLGNLLSYWGEIKKDVYKLTNAAAAYSSSLNVYEKLNMPLDWAQTQKNLGITLKLLGKLKSDPEILHQAIIAFTSTTQIFWMRQMMDQLNSIAVNVIECKEILKSLNK